MAIEPVWITVIRDQAQRNPARRPKARLRKWYSPPASGYASASSA